MIIGVPREIKDQEFRVALPPSGAYQLIKCYIELLADLGLAEACHRQPALLGGINIMRGQVSHPAVADALGFPYTRPVLA